MKHNVISVVLGGGKGTRLYPLTHKRSKPAVPIAGKYRLVDIPISNCLNSGYNRIFVLTQYNSASLNSHIKNTYNFSVFSKGFVDILAAEQTHEGDRWYQGTADAVRHLQRYLAHHDYEHILILSGDQLYQIDFQEMIEHHIEAGAEISVATIPVNAKDATSFGILKSDDEGNITSFIEKPSTDKLAGWESDVSADMEEAGRVYLASMGIYVFNKAAMTKLLSEHQGMDFGKELIPDSIGTYKVHSYEYRGYWTDIGTIDSFFEANIGLTDDIPKFNLFDKNTIFTRGRMLPPSKVSGTTLDKVVIADGCIVAAERIEQSVIGVRSRIGTGTVIKTTYMMGCDFYQTLDEIDAAHEQGVPLAGVGEHCYIENAILDKNCCIGNNVRITGGSHLEDGDFETHAVQDGVVVVKKRAVLPSGTVIG
ncbi:glucose-1-phosphate adenylyltransferase [Parapedobacter sp. 10938]|uniref:glucose-1-phosphate adenylyltransferase n=1 Tax=Parapedobacter flavus TaxID=3110225 RepID=UPI002DB9C8A4|nr:glucose-1-phosphate adenylyltransferase [Parapedobacter sp. 10938]MEC3881025.1 glucose-1-phosphate adenylyltransferase [Parapedobacter sp. 10938]